MEGESGFFFPDYLNTLLQVIRMLDVRPERFERAVEHLRKNVLAAANALVKAHSIRVPGLHGVLVAVKGLEERVVVPNRFAHFTRQEMKRIRDVLEEQYGIVPLDVMLSG